MQLDAKAVLLLSIAQLLVASSVSAAEKKLSFLFRRDLNHDASFYCPPKHLSTFVEDLCYNVNPLRKSRKTAIESCKKVSNRLAEIDSDESWLALLSSLAKYYKTLEMEDELVNLRFHLGRLVHLHQSNQWVWKSSLASWNDRYTCRKKNSPETKPYEPSNRTSICVELLDRDLLYESMASSNSCLRLVDCDRIRYSICEWRGNSLQNFSSQLRHELIHSFISVLVVSVLFCLCWLILYQCHTRWLDDDLDAQLAAYKKHQLVHQILFQTSKS